MQETLVEAAKRLHDSGYTHGLQPYIPAVMPWVLGEAQEGKANTVSLGPSAFTTEITTLTQ